MIDDDASPLNPGFVLTIAWRELHPEDDRLVEGGQVIRFDTREAAIEAARRARQHGAGTSIGDIRIPDGAVDIDVDVRRGAGGYFAHRAGVDLPGVTIAEGFEGIANARRVLAQARPPL